VIGPIVTAVPQELDRAPVLTDVRWYLDGRNGREAYEAAHLPGAVFVDMDTVLSDHDQPATAGRHPLPSPERFAARLGALGIGDDDVVIAYDDSGGGTAGRLVVMLRAIGRQAALLSGGLTAWVADGGAVEHGPGAARTPVTREATPWPADRFAAFDDVADLAPGVVHLDARPPDRYAGSTEPVDPRAGHIPGAVNVPWGGNLRDGRFLPPEELRARFAALGVTEPGSVIASCGSGVSACANVLALEAAGLGPVRLFVPSFSGWSSDAARPVSTGGQ
jgi:thiosulfate/3-mercaptopyruvate sulfurtransferase